MAGNSQRRSLRGKGPTPKAEDRPYHKAYRKRRPDEPGKTPGKAKRGGAGKPARQTAKPGADWVFGRNPVYEALQAGLPIKRAFVAEGVERDDRLRDILAFAAANGISLLQATRAELDRMTGGGVHQGVALQLPPYEYADILDILESTQPIVALDSITDPHNLGAIIRSAAAFGAAVVIPERRSAQVTAAAWKASAGAAARVPVARVVNLNRTLRQAADSGYTIVGLAGEAETPITEVTGDPVCLVVGSEGDGLSRLVRENCDVLAAIPITSAIESLNASVAAGIALWELAK
ncbi:MAG: 23S rRNA (guanosine(2251)-2'-O)-methyltransferase RlmB [Propionibacteriaceae bacterium]|jgi:23S rRNA (guanosine2251-2'-O)-methyltransferase|nr:23S rRNA (guanosine(2251)-2'-O)-methyltransferase RlmB [Propionibacteriaceae bacterium]